MPTPDNALVSDSHAEMIPARGGPARVYGEPYETPDGATVITVAKLGRGGSAGTPLGIFVIKDGVPTWEAAVDANRVAIIGVLTGLVAAGLTAAALLRRPPWPDLKITT